MKKILLLLFSIVSSVFLLELCLQIIKPKMLFDSANHVDCFSMDKIKDKDSFDNKLFKYLYIDIYDNYLNLKNGICYVQRQNPFMPNDYKNRYFKKKKDKDVKRIFIIGESVADFYPKEFLEKNLMEFVPNQKFEVINAGTCSYESVRINRILNEVIKYDPDYFIVCIGNNDGLFEPIEINYFPYKYKLFRTSYILNRLSNYFIKRKYYNVDDIQPFFEKNIIKMIMATKNKCPIIFVTLPRNLEWKDNLSFIDNFPLINNTINDDETAFVNRRNFLRKLPQKYSWVKIIDYDKELKSHTFPGYNVFRDLEHYHDCFYDLISKMFIEQCYNISFNIDKEYIDSLLKYAAENNIHIDENFSPYDRDIKLLKILYLHNTEYFMTLFNKYYEEKYYSKIFPWLHILILYDNDKKLLFSCFNKLDKANINSYEYYFLKALGYYKYNNIDMAKTNLDIANKLLKEFKSNNSSDIQYITINDFEQCKDFWINNSKK